MTIIIGIICKGAIVVASDSQTTHGGLKRTDAEKIVPVKFATGEVLVAQAGNAGNSARAIEILREMAKDRPVDDYRVPPDLARLAMMQLKHELRQQYCDCTVEELRDLIWKDELQTELLLAYYFDGKPYLYKIDLAVGRSDKETSWCAAMGCGSNLGSYLLSEYTKPEMSYGLATIFASYVIETVCKHDAYCSPPAKVGLIINDIAAAAGTVGPAPEVIHPSAHGTAFVVIYAASTTTTWANKVEKIIQSEKLRRNKRLELLLKREVAKGQKQFREMLADPTPKGYKRFLKMRKAFSAVSHMEFIRAKQPGAVLKASK